MHNQVTEKLKQWDGHYYVKSFEDDGGVVVGRESKVEQTVLIEMLDADHPDRQKMELEIRRMIEGTDWKISSDGFFENGYSKSECEIFIYRDIKPDGDLFKEDFEERIEI